MYAQILIATDGSELAARALDQGLKLAKTLGSKVTIVTVTEPEGAHPPAVVAFCKNVNAPS